jgi:glyoxylase-like metal-dependent hydrolase (beta-lactamase superfamily II)
MGQQKIIPIFLKYSNAHLIKNNVLALVDTGYTGNADRILAAIREEGKPKELSLIIITHGHLDHIGSLPGLRKALAAKVVIHRSDMEALRTGRSTSSKKASILGRLVGSQGGKGWDAIEPDIIVDGEMDLKDFGIDGVIIPTPGHTAGSLSILLGSGEALVGDLVVGGMINHRKPSYSLLMEDRGQVTKSVIGLLERGAKIFYGSHGGPFTAEEVRKNFAP